MSPDHDPEAASVTTIAARLPPTQTVGAYSSCRDAAIFVTQTASFDWSAHARRHMGMYQLLDRAPLGRNETGFWWRRARPLSSLALGSGPFTVGGRP
jgi:predicted dithiol-disulfide oxidoreductase (DUF899 family)